MLDYRPAGSGQRRGDRLVLAGIALLSGALATGVLVGTVDLCVTTWPSFGMTLVAVPSGVVATAFGSIAWAALRAARTNE